MYRRQREKDRIMFDGCLVQLRRESQWIALFWRIGIQKASVRLTILFSQQVYGILQSFKKKAESVLWHRYMVSEEEDDPLPVE